MKMITLTKGMETIIDDCDFEWLSQWNWHARAGGKHRRHHCAARGVSNGKNMSIIYMHREIAKPPKGMVVDHINGNPLDNRRMNLRICTQRQNSMNMKASPMAGIQKRVRGNCIRWMVNLSVEGKWKYICSCISEEDAIKARNEAALRIRGQFSRFHLPKSA